MPTPRRTAAVAGFAFLIYWIAVDRQHYGMWPFTRSR